MKAQYTPSGNVKHAKTLGANGGERPEVFVEEISGSAFSASAPGLGPGTYPPVWA